MTFTADTVEYDQQKSLVIAKGHVEAWQNGHVLRADQVTFDRNTGVAAASGHVVLIEPSGQVLFADYAELDQGMSDGILTAMRALLAENGKLAANGARRTGGVINDMSKVVYSTCNLCKQDPERPPLWQIRAHQRHRRTPSTSGSNTTTRRCRCSASRSRYFPYFWHRRSVIQADQRAARALSFGISSSYRRVLRPALLLGASTTSRTRRSRRC